MCIRDSVYTDVERNVINNIDFCGIISAGPGDELFCLIKACVQAQEDSPIHGASCSKSASKYSQSLCKSISLKIVWSSSLTVHLQPLPSFLHYSLHEKNVKVLCF